MIQREKRCPPRRCLARTQDAFLKARAKYEKKSKAAKPGPKLLLTVPTRRTPQSADTVCQARVAFFFF
jgi:hypothetical protein